MSAFDDLRATLAAAPADAVCVWGTVEQLRAVVAEHDALRERRALVSRAALDCDRGVRRRG